MQSFGDVECRSSDEGILASALEELGQSTFNESIYAAYQSHHPHPEYRTGSANYNSRRNSGQVARAYP